MANIFHHIGGEMEISLHEVKAIGLLPIIGAPYEEFIPTNRRMLRDDLGEMEYDLTISELLRINAHLCDFFRCKKIS